MNDLKIGQKVYYLDSIGTVPSGCYTIDSEELIDYGFGSEDVYYYFEELTNPDISRDGRTRAWKNRIIALDTLLVCVKCGGTNITRLVEQNPNTKEIVGDIKDLVVRCYDCNCYTRYDTREAWEESRKPIVL